MSEVQKLALEQIRHSRAMIALGVTGIHRNRHERAIAEALAVLPRSVA